MCSWSSLLWIQQKGKSSSPLIRFKWRHQPRKQVNLRELPIQSIQKRRARSTSQPWLIGSFRDVSGCFQIFSRAPIVTTMRPHQLPTQSWLHCKLHPHSLVLKSHFVLPALARSVASCSGSVLSSPKGSHGCGSDPAPPRHLGNHSPLFSCRYLHRAWM